MTDTITKEESKWLRADDSRTKLLNAAIKKSKSRPDALIQVLHTAQGMFGYLPIEIIRHIADQMQLPASRVYGVVTFYHFFSLTKKGEHTCLVCTGTACYVKGAQDILDQIESKYHLKPGDVSKDNRLGVEVARCLGACGLAPAVVIDDEVIPKLKPEDTQSVIEAKTGVD